MNTSEVAIVGGGLAGSEAALQLANQGITVRLYEMRPQVKTPVHTSSGFAELVCSNSLKSTKPESAAGMLKHELELLGSILYREAQACSVPAGGALAVDRHRFSERITTLLEKHPFVTIVREEVQSIAQVSSGVSAVILASGPLTSDALAADLREITGQSNLAFYDAAAPIVMADSLDETKLFRQSRYENETGVEGDYLNAPFTKEEYDQFISELLGAECVIKKKFETRDLFQACQPIEEIARKGTDAPRFGSLKPVGLLDPRTGRRPWAALQLRAEDAYGSCYNLVGFQTNLTFGEQKRVFRLIPGLDEAEFVRYGVMHRNTFVNAPQLLDSTLCVRKSCCGKMSTPVYIAGQLSGTEGYCEAIRSGLQVALNILAQVRGIDLPPVPELTVFGALLSYATNSDTKDYQPMHVNFGILKPLDTPIKNKGLRYAEYARRGEEALLNYCEELVKRGIIKLDRDNETSMASTSVSQEFKES